MLYERDLTPENFSMFVRCLSVLRDNCRDVDIKKGMIRERTDRLTSIFQIDLSSILPDAEIVIGDIKESLDLLKPFLERDVKLIVDEKGCSFVDEYSKSYFAKPMNEFIDNKFVSDKELDKVIQIVDEDLILDVDLPRVVTDRINVYGRGYSVNTMQIRLDGESASLHMKPISNDREIKFIGDMVMNKSLDGCYISNIVTVPFIIDHDNDMNLKSYISSEKSTILNKFSSTIEDADIVIYSTAEIRKEGDED
jgi:hypothetical protein